MLRILLLGAFAVICACGNNADTPKLEDPQEMQKPADAIPDSMTIQNDSVITPDSANGR